MTDNNPSPDATTETTQVEDTTVVQEAAQAPETVAEVVQEPAPEQAPAEEPAVEVAADEPAQEEKPTDAPVVEKTETAPEVVAEAPAPVVEVVEPVAEAPVEEHVEEPAVEVAEVPETVVEEPAPVVAVPETPIVETTVTETASPAPTVPLLTAMASDDDNVKDLKLMLAAFIVKNSVPGKKSIDFLESAKQLALITNYIIAHPKKEVLNLFLAFITENADGVASRTEYSKGVDKLSSIDEQKINYLYNVFYDMAKHSLVGISTGKILTVLKKPEIADYYTRKLAFFKQEAGK